MTVATDDLSCWTHGPGHIEATTTERGEEISALFGALSTHAVPVPVRPPAVPLVGVQEEGQQLCLPDPQPPQKRATRTQTGHEHITAGQVPKHTEMPSGVTVHEHGCCLMHSSPRPHSGPLPADCCPVCTQPSISRRMHSQGSAECISRAPTTPSPVATWPLP